MTRGYAPQWDVDLPYGEAGERWVEQIALHPDHAEVKRDGKFLSTGNLYVEYECRGRDGTWRPSGLATTQAEVWVHILGDLNAAFVISTERLKDICRPLLRRGCTAEERDGSNPTKGVLVNAVEFVAGLSPLALAGAKRRQQRLGKGNVCISCGDSTVRMWAVPADQQTRYGKTVPYCRLCEPFEGEPITT